MKLFLLFAIVLVVVFGLTFLYFSQPPAPITLSSVTPSSTPIPFQFSPDLPPKDSLVGTIASASGEILWQSRSATSPAVLAETTSIRQGETLITKSTGRAALTFPRVGLINIFPDTTLDFVQTLPVNVVITQSQGSAQYLTAGSVPLSVKSLHLLTAVPAGDVVITKDKSRPLIYIDIYQGAVTLGFNDLHYVSRTPEFSSGQRVIFNDTTRRLTTQKLPPRK